MGGAGDTRGSSRASKYEESSGESDRGSIEIPVGEIKHREEREETSSVMLLVPEDSIRVVTHRER